jgi:hypothetical protein
MKLLCLAMFCFVSCCFAEIELVGLQVPEITGEVGMAVWQEAHDFPIVAYQNDEEKPFKGAIHIGSGWNVFLRNVTGVNDATRRAISDAAESGEGFLRTVASMYKTEPGGMLVAVKGPQSMRLTDGTRVRLRKCSFKFGILGLVMECEDFSIIPKSQTTHPASTKDRTSPTGKGAPPDNRRSAPRQPPEGQPTAKPGSEPEKVSPRVPPRPRAIPK